MTPDKDFWAVFPEIRLFETRIIKVQVKITLCDLLQRFTVFKCIVCGILTFKIQETLHPDTSYPKNAKM